MASQAAPEADSGGGADLEELVERQENCGWFDAGLVDMHTKRRTACSTRRSALSAPSAGSTGRGGRRNLGSARSAGRLVRAITLGRACGAQTTELGLVPAVLAKS